MKCPKYWMKNSLIENVVCLSLDPILCCTIQLTSCGIVAEGDEYQVFRKAANQQWDSVKSCYQKVRWFHCVFFGFDGLIINETVFSILILRQLPFC